MAKNTAEVPDFTSRDLVSSYLDGMVEAVTYVDENIIPLINRGLLGGMKDSEQAILGIFYRMHALASSMTRLNNIRDFNAMAIVTRTLFELLLDLKMLSNASPQDVERFGSFARVNRFKGFAKLVELQKDNPGMESHTYFDSDSRKVFVEDIDRGKEIQKILDKLWNGQYPEHWSGLKIRARAEKFGPLYCQEYLEIYSLLSWYAHAGNTAYSGFGADMLEGVYGIALNIGRKIYIEGLIICAKAFSLHQALESFFRVVNFLREAPTEILIQYGLDKMKSGQAG